MSTITVVGNLTADPEVRFTPSGAAVANFTIADTPRRYDKQADAWVDGDTTFWNAAVWRQAAENVAESLTKGQRVIAVGEVRNRAYEDRDGNKRTSLELEVREIGPALKYATAVVSKVSRSGSSGPQQGGTDPWASNNDQAPF